MISADPNQTLQIGLGDETLSHRRPPDLTFVVPFFNEEPFLRATCESLAQQSMGGYFAEVLLIDGRSTDASAAIAREFTRISAGSVGFRVLENRRRTTPNGFNIGIAAANGRFIGFGGAHTVYPKRYFKTAIELLQTGNAQVVGGGASSFKTSGDGRIAEAMGWLYRSRIGAGVAAYWRKREPGFVDTVFGGFYQREVFSTIGVFDTRLARNQDNELNSRVTRAGFRILFHPDLSSEYVIKTDPKSFFFRAFRFGFFHPETWLVNPRSIKVRHIVPAFFTLYIIGMLFLAFQSWWFVVPFVVYATLLLMEAARISRYATVDVGVATIPIFFAFHFVYGLGTLAGVGDAIRRLLIFSTGRRDESRVETSRSKTNR